MKLRNKNIVDVWDPHHLSPYAYWERQWVGYDDIESITIKAKYARAMGLGGGMVWSIETDDFKGICGDGKYPLLNAIKRVLNQPEVPSMPMPNEREETTTTGPEGSSTSTMRPTEPTTSRQPSTTTSTTTTQQATTSWSTTSRRPEQASTSTTTVRSPTTSTSSTSYTTSKWWPYPPSTWWPRPSSSIRPGSTVWWGGHSANATTPSTPLDNKIENTAVNSIETEDIPLKPSTATLSSTSKASTDFLTPSSTTQSTTSKTTPSPVKNEESKPEKEEFTCREAGLYRNPNNCLAFVRCIETRIEGAFQVFHHECPDKTVFNNLTKLCDWVENVPECLRQVPKHYLRGIQLPGEAAHSQ